MTEVAERLEEALWDALKHPRGRGGLWRDVVGHEVAGIVEQIGERRDGPQRPGPLRKDKPLHRTEAFRRGVRRSSYMTQSGSHGDEFMYDLAVDQGFASRPHAVSEEELRAHIANGDRELWRGVSDESYAQALVSGTAFYGQGFRGNGIYAAGGGKAETMARSYAQAPPTRGTITSKADKPVVVHMALMKEAKTVTYAEASGQARSEHLRLSGEKGGQEGTGGRAPEVLALANSSPTRWAMVNGYDAVIVPQDDGSDEVVVLNRTALVVSTEFQDAGRNVARRMRERPGA